jgi:trimeric autotransporter adhesin
MSSNTTSILRAGTIIVCIAAAFPVGAQQTPVYSVRTVAGHDANGDGGLATKALIGFPTKTVVDTAGNVYIAEGPGPVRRVFPDGVISTVGTAGFSYGFASDDAGNLYVTPGCKVQRLNVASGTLKVIAGDGRCAVGPDGPAAATSFFTPQALAFDLQGGLLVAEPYAHRIRRIDLGAGTITTIAGDGTAGATKGDGGPALKAQIGSPQDLGLDAQGDIFFVDSANCLLRKIDAGTFIIHTLAGNGTCGFAGDGGAPLAAQLNTPQSLAVNAAGNLVYVGEIAAGRIRQVNLDTSKIATYAGTGTAGIGGDGGPAIQAPVGSPFGVTFDKNGNLLVTDYLDSRVRSIDASQTIHTFAGAPSDGGDGGPAVAATLNGPGDVVPDGKGGFIISDVANRKIRAVSAAGVISLVAGTNFLAGSTGNGGPATSAGLAISYGMTADSHGTIYFTEATGGVRKISGGVINQVGPTNWNFPTGIAADPTGQFVYVSEYSGDRIVKLDVTTGAVTTFAGLGAPGANGSPGNNGDGPATQKMLNGPADLATDASGNVYVLDTLSLLIRKINLSTGVMVTVAGNGKSGSTGDGGPASAAGVSNLSGLTVDSGGNLFFSEGPRIRRVDAATGNIATVAGNGTSGFSGDGGPSLNAQIGAGALGADGQGNIYFVDQGDRIRVLSAPIAGPRIAAAIVAASFGAGVSIAAGTWLEIYGEKLSPTNRQWAGSDFNGNKAPTSLDNVQVLVEGQAAAVDVISPGQINAQVPDGIGTGNVTVQVVNPIGSSDPVLVLASARAPALLAPPSFTAGGRFYAAALYPDRTFVGPAGLIPGGAFRPARAGDHIILYGIGFGSGTPAVPAGTIANVSTTLPNVSFRVGGAKATVEYAGLAGGFVGLYQFNIVVPSGVTGDALLEVSVDGVPITQTLFLAVQ